MSLFKDKNNSGKIIVELDAEVAEALALLAERDTVGTAERRMPKSVSQKAAELLEEAVWNRKESLLPNHTPPFVRMANALMAHSIDAGATAIRLTQTPEGIALEQEKAGEWHVVRELLAGDSNLAYLPRHIQRPIFDRFEKMAGVRLQSRTAHKTARVPIAHNKQNHDITVGYEDNPNAETGESMVVRFLNNSALSAPA